MHEFLHLGWIVHPLGALTLAFLSSVIFTERRRGWPPVAGAVVLVALLTELGARWLPHPAAALSLALLASTIFHAWRREWATVVFALLALVLFSALGAGWVVYPAGALALAWIATVVFSGDLFRPQPLQTSGRPARVERAGSGHALGAAGQALPPPAGGDIFDPSFFTEHERRERGEAREERKRERKLAKLQRKAEKLGVPLQPVQPAVQLSKEPQSVPIQAAPTDLLGHLHDERLPGEARARLGALHLRCQEALKYLQQRDLAAAEPAYLVRQIEGDYAPEAVRAYLRLPPSLAGVTRLDGDKTGRDLLNGQLDLLLQAVQDVMQGAAQANGQSMLAHERFLKDKFGKKAEDFEL